MSFFSELKRRNVIRTGIAYVVAAWVIVEVASVLLPTFEAPEWILRVVVLVLVAGLPLALLIAWVFELTPQGIRKEDNTDTPDEIVFKTRNARKSDRAITLALALLVIYFVSEKIWFSDVVRGDTNAIAVLPFSDMSPQQNQAYFAEGLTVELLNMLSMVADLRVTGKTSAFQFKDYKGDFRQIGESLNVDTILEGSVRAVDNSVRITTNLVDAENGHTLWSANYDRQLDDIIQVQDEIARAVVEALEAQLLESTDEPVKRKVVAEAYKAYQQGSYLQGKLTVDDQQAAIKYFLQAIDKDPSYAEAMVGIANANLMLALNMVAIDREEGIGKATVYLDQALRLNPGLANAHVANALIKQVNARDFKGAEQDLKRALQLNPSDVTALRRLGTIYGMQARYDEAMENFQKIIDRDPLNMPTYSNYSYNALAAGRLEIAEEMITKVLEFSPDSIFANFQLARVFMARNDLVAAGEAIKHEPHPVWRNIGTGMLACLENDGTTGFAIANELIEQRELFNAAEIYQLCGDSEKVFELLQQAARDHDPALTEMQLSWAMSNLRDDPRWLEILVTVGLPIKL